MTRASGFLGSMPSRLLGPVDTTKHIAHLRFARLAARVPCALLHTEPREHDQALAAQREVRSLARHLRVPEHRDVGVILGKASDEVRERALCARSAEGLPTRAVIVGEFNAFLTTPRCRPADGLDEAFLGRHGEPLAGGVEHGEEIISRDQESYRGVQLILAAEIEEHECPLLVVDRHAKHDPCNLIGAFDESECRSPAVLASKGAQILNVHPSTVKEAGSS